MTKSCSLLHLLRNFLTENFIFCAALVSKFWKNAGLYKKARKHLNCLMIKWNSQLLKNCSIKTFKKVTQNVWYLREEINKGRRIMVMKENFSFCLLTACLRETKKIYIFFSSYFLLLFLLSPFTTQKSSFPKRISPVIVTKSAVSFYWKNSEWKTSFFVKCLLSINYSMNIILSNKYNI